MVKPKFDLISVGDTQYDVFLELEEETKLLKDAKSLGLNTLNGVEMLVKQGAESFKIWLNLKEAPVDIFRLFLK